MKILIIGSGGREHAIAYKCSQSPKITQIFMATGNAGTQGLDKVKNIDIAVGGDNFEQLTQFAIDEQIDFTIVGPEVPLAEGVVDYFRNKGLKIFGADKQSAVLESSKSFAKQFMSKYNIPTADFVVCTDYEMATRHIDDFGYPVVIKADGLAAGKGVVIADNREEALSTLKQMMVDNVFEDAGKTVLIEKCLVGVEASLLCLVDGKNILPLQSAKDYKRIYDNDKGANTGGMGTLSPHPMFDDALNKKIQDKILLPFIHGVQDEKMDYRGIVFIGLMLVNDGDEIEPMVIEFNVRFGDPETQVVLPRLQTDMADILMAVEHAQIDKLTLQWIDESAVCVIAASAGYPSAYEKGMIITGVDDANLVFHSGTKISDGKLKTSGGRVLGVVGFGETLESARNNAYEDMKKISFEGMQYRKDIGII